MKISKLFHWLYGILMFLPVFAVGIKCLYVVFNDNAKDSYSGTYQYESNIQVSNIATESIPNAITPFIINLPVNSNMYINCDEILDINSTGWRLSNIVYLPIDLINSSIDELNSYNGAYEGVYIEITGVAVDSKSLVFGFYDADYNLTSLKTIIFSYNNYNIKYSIFGTLKDNSIYYNATNSGATKNLPYLNNIGSHSYYISYVNDMTLSSVFYSSLQELDNVEFFSWAKNSFLATPFMYIGNLFSIPSVHPIFTFLSYWMAISVIWLVFDLFMYVPLLVHRWLDKGIVE